MRKREYEDIQRAMALKNMKFDELPGDLPKVVDLEYTLGEDQGGDPSIFVMVFLDDDTPESAWIPAKLNPIRDRLRQVLEENGIDRWLYARYVTRAELNEAQAEEDAA